MTLDVIDSMKKNDAVVNIDLKAPVESFEYLSEEISFAGDVELKGKFSREQSKCYAFVGAVCAKVVLNCGKCLSKYSVDCEFPVELHFSQKEKAIDDELDMYYTDGDTVCFDEAIQTNVIMNIPATRLCSESCKGICPVCGVNLNIECCKCGENGSSLDDVDPRFAALKDFFEK